MSNRDVLLIQDNDDGTFAWQVPELNMIGTEDDAETAMEEAFKAIADNPTVFRITIQDAARAEGIRNKIATLQGQVDALNVRLAELTKETPVVAHKLLEDTRTVERFVRFLFIDYPAEEFLGEIKAVGFHFPYDRDGDGDVSPSLYNTQMIEADVIEGD